MDVGDQVSDFELQDETGTPRRLSTLLRDGPVVLFFYPVASSGGCTREACHFRDLAAEFAALGARPVGISGDTVSAQSRFATAHSLGYPLLSDAGRQVAREFGARRSWLPGGLQTKRRTFVIGSDRRILAVVSGETRFDRHADEALAALREHRAAGGPGARAVPPADHAVVDGRTVTSSAVVAAPPAEVFALLANPHRHHEFDGSGTVRAAVSGPQRLALGDRFGMRMEIGLPYRVTNRVVELEEDRRIGWCHPARAIWRYELEPVDGGTRITETFDFRGSPVARGIELAGMHRNNARSIRDTLRRLQRILGTP